MAREIGLDIANVPGSGVKGRISVDDVKAFARQKLNRSMDASMSGSALPDLSAFGAIRAEPLTGIEQATAANMQRAWREMPHAWLTASIDITLLEEHRQKHKALVAQAGGSLSITVFIVKALALLLQQQPRFNASFDAVNSQLVYRDFIDVGVAVDTPRGLIVPVLRAVDEMNLEQLAVALSTLVARARDGKLTPKDMQGGGITLSNLGGFGVSGLYPIINWPQPAIVGVGSAVSVDNRLSLPVTLGFDHRVINGADGGRFLQAMRALLEDPFLFSLRG
jgi:pyruvate dehydrogenase E2 component (dihydrolipoamide acetyltransferase)